MNGLVMAGVQFGLLASFVFGIVTILFALMLRKLPLSWTVGRLAFLASSLVPITMVTLLALLIVALSGGDWISGPEAQGLTILGMAGLVVVGPGWLVCYWLARGVLRQREIE